VKGIGLAAARSDGGELTGASRKRDSDWVFGSGLVGERESTMENLIRASAR
jgi:hypothetical protein